MLHLQVLKLQAAELWLQEAHTAVIIRNVHRKHDINSPNPR